MSCASASNCAVSWSKNVLDKCDCVVAVVVVVCIVDDCVADDDCVVVDDDCDSDCDAIETSTDDWVVESDFVDGEGVINDGRLVLSTVR